MATTVEEVLTGTLGEINIGAGAAVGLLNPLAAQLDLMVALGLGPLKSDLSAQFNASLALQAALTLRISDPTEGIRQALRAIVELQASLSAALALAAPQVELGAELGASVALSAALTARLAALNLLIDASLSLKIPAVRTSADLNAALTIGPAVVLTFDGVGEGSTLAEVGGLINSAFSAGVGNPAIGRIEPGDLASGVIIVTKEAGVYAQLGVLIQT